MADASEVKFSGAAARKVGAAVFFGTRTDGGVGAVVKSWGDVEIVISAFKDGAAITLTIGRDDTDSPWRTVNGERIDHRNRMHCLAFWLVASGASNRGTISNAVLAGAAPLTDSEIGDTEMAKRTTTPRTPTTAPDASAAPAGAVVAVDDDTVDALFNAAKVEIFTAIVSGTHDATEHMMDTRLNASAFRAEWKPGSQRGADNRREARAALTARLSTLTALPALTDGADEK